VETNTQRRRNGPSLRAFARAVAGIRRDPVASGTVSISMIEIDREIAVARSLRDRTYKRTTAQF